jgi:hypothetical protein
VFDRERERDALVGRRPVVDDQRTAAAAGIGDRFALRRLDADIARGHGAHPQLLGNHLEPRQRTHAGDQRQFRDRLGQKVVGPGFEPAHPVGRLIERGNHDHRNMMGDGVGLQPPADFEPVHVGHHHVEQDEIAFGALAHVQRIPAVHRREHVEIFGGKPRFQKLDVGGDIVNHENAGGYLPYTYGLPRKWRMVSMNLPTEMGLER